MKKRLLAAILGLSLIFGNVGIAYASDSISEDVAFEIAAETEELLSENSENEIQEDKAGAEINDDSEVDENAEEEDDFKKLDSDSDSDILEESVISETDEVSQKKENNIEQKDDNSSKSEGKDTAHENAPDQDISNQGTEEFIDSEKKDENNKQATIEENDGTEIEETMSSEAEEEVITAEPAFSDGNNSAQTARNIQVNSYYSDSIIKSGKDNWYIFSISTPGYVDFLFSHDYVDRSLKYWKLYLYRQDDLNTALLEREYIGNEMNEVVSYGTGLPADTYYIKIKNSSYSAVPYTFMARFTESYYYEKERNDTAVTATAVSLNTYYHGNLMKSSDKDWYSFTLPSSGYISTTFSHDYLDKNWKYWRLFLYNSDNLNSAILERGYLGNELEEVTHYGTGLPAGTYYIKILDSYFSEKGYQFKINFTASESWEQEVNNSAESANTIFLDRYYNGNLKTSSDVDWYTFTLNDYQKCSITFSHEYVDKNLTYWRLKLYSSSNMNSPLLDKNYKGNVTGEISDQLYLSSGTYYLKIFDSNYSVVPYKIKVQKLKEDQNLYVSACSPIVAGKTATISVSGAAGTLSFKSGNTSVATVNAKTGKITAKTPGTVKITVTAAATTNYYKATKSITIKVIPKAASLSSVKKKAKGFVAKWKKVSGITGYQLQYSTKSTFSSKKTVTISKASTTLKTVKGLTAPKTYYVRIRTYKTVNGKIYYSSWSKKVKVKI